MSNQKSWSNDVRTIYSAMNMTETGRGQWNKMATSDNKISMSINKVNVKTDIYKNEIQNSNATTNTPVKDDKNYNTVLDKNGTTNITVWLPTLTESAKNSGLTVMEQLGATMSHEAEHAADKNNIDLIVKSANLQATGDEVEKVPIEKANAVKEELKNPIKELKPKELKMSNEPEKIKL